MELHLDRLTLRLSGVSEADGRRLAELVGQHLAEATPPGSGGASALGVSLAAQPGEALDALARRIVDEMLRSLARSS